MKELNYDRIKEKIEKDIALTVDEFAFINSVNKFTVYKWGRQGMPLENRRPHRLNYKKCMKWLAEGGNHLSEK